MDSPQNKLYLSLKKGHTLGPEHHRFRLTAKVGENATGMLWQAEDLSTKRPFPVTLHFIHPKLLRQKGYVDELKKQISFTKSLNFKHIAKIYGYFIQKGGLFFIATEQLDGLTLAELLKSGKSDKLKPAQKKGLLMQLGLALDTGYRSLRRAHGALAPDQIYINRQGGIKLTGFCSRSGGEIISPLLNPPLQYPVYQSPEAFHPGNLTFRADIYSYAAVAYHLLSGKAPFSANDSESDRVSHELSAPESLAENQWQGLLKGFETRPDDRHISATELCKALFQPEPETAEEPDNEKASKDDEQTPDEDSTLEESPKQSLKEKLGSKIPLPPMKWLIPPLLFLVGIAVGFWLGFMVSDQRVSGLNEHLTKMQQGSIELQSALAAEQRGHEQLKQQYASLKEQFEKQQLAAEQAIQRENAEMKDNLTAFRDELTSGFFGPDMVILPKGQFRMGDLNGQGDDNELPVRTVTIPKPFALSRYEVTFEQYDRFADATGRQRPADEGWGRGKQPVINISWQEANAFTEWLAAETGQPYRLPTEAEWEYASRASTESAFWWGNELRRDKAVCDECGGEFAGQQPAPVGSTPANPWGIHDMNGNVDEWVQDCYLDSYEGAATDASAVDIPNCRHRVMRGGSWFDIGRLIRSASRYRHPANRSRNTWGFRVALELPASQVKETQ